MTINLDDDLVKEAQRLTGTRDLTALIHDGLRALIARESARRASREQKSEGREQRRGRMPLSFRYKEVILNNHDNFGETTCWRARHDTTALAAAVFAADVGVVCADVGQRWDVVVGLGAVGAGDYAE